MSILLVSASLLAALGAIITKCFVSDELLVRQMHSKGQETTDGHQRLHQMLPSDDDVTKERQKFSTATDLGDNGPTR